MNEEILHEIIRDSDLWIKKWHKCLLIDLALLATNAANAAAVFLDSWSLDLPWLIPLGFLLGILCGLLAYNTRRAYRFQELNKRLRKSAARLLEAYKFLPITTSPAESAYDQVMACFEDIKRI